MAIGLTTQNPKRFLGRADDIEEARELAACYLTDPKDNITVVHFYDERNQHYCGWLRREDVQGRRKHKAA